MRYKDYYQILEVKRSASQAEIKAAYKKLAMRWHPDRNPNDTAAEARFKAINEAHTVLGDPSTRKRYDQIGSGPFATTVDPVEESEVNDLFSRFFEEIFGGKKGHDQEAFISISLEEAFRGLEEMLAYSGRRMKVYIPRGVRHGQILRLKGMGGKGRKGGSAGDLLLTVRIHPHGLYSRQGDDLYRDYKVDLYSLVLGERIKVPTLHGPKFIRLPVNANGSDRLKLKGLGMPVYGKKGLFGDLYLDLKIQMPGELSPKEKDLFERLRKLRKP